MIKEISKSVLPLAFAMLAVVTSGCSDDDDNSFPEKDGQLLVTKVETQTNYVDERWEDFIPIRDYDLTEMKYDEQGELTEWWDNGVCTSRYTYTEGKILVRDEPDLGPYEHILSPEGKVVETVYADGSRDKLTYDEKGQCVEINHKDGYSTLLQWADGQVTSMRYPDVPDLPTYRFEYTDIPKKSNAAYLRFMMLNTGGYFVDMEISGHLDISSDKYLPAKAVLEYEDGYMISYEAAYDLTPDGTVKTMHVTMNEWMSSSPETTYLAYKGDVTFAYTTKTGRNS